MGGNEMTPKERVMSVYRGEKPDRIPVMPCFWYLIPARMSGRPFYDIEEPFWYWQWQVGRYYGIDQRVAPKLTWKNENVRKVEERHLNGEGWLSICTTYYTEYGTLTSRCLHPPDGAAWDIERPVKDIERDWRAYEEVFFCDPSGLDTSDFDQCLETVGEDAVVPAVIGGLFTDMLADAREGGMEQAIYDLYDYPDFFAQVRERYARHRAELTEAILKKTAPDFIFIATGATTANVVGPDMWRTWNLPAVKAITDVAHSHGKPVHIHLHGHCRALLPDIANLGIEMVCPLERPPGGDIEDLRQVREEIKPSLGFMGNISTTATLLTGTPEDVEREVRECIEAASNYPFILSTGDQVSPLTPEENIKTLVAAGKKYGIK
ncbi:MAG: hypothetical protein HPY71_02730 [Firmicutes bacterium]|nr:hypothetical protein [Bacillota bacterium]